MKKIHDLSQLKWTLTGYTPHLWRQEKTHELGLAPKAEVPPIPVTVPGSVQQALRDADLLPDWNVGFNARQCEWVENRHWIYETDIPDEWLPQGKSCRLRCEGLDYCGVIRMNGVDIHSFRNTWLPQVVDLSAQRVDTGNRLQIIFEHHPRWLGTPGWTSRVREWKPRFNYTWDWIVRIVQIGIWDDVLLEVMDVGEIDGLRVLTDYDSDSGSGELHLSGSVTGAESGSLHIELSSGGAQVRQAQMPVSEFVADGMKWDGLNIDPWWPNGEGEQPLYSLALTLRDADGKDLDRIDRRVGFKRVRWEPCRGAAEEADPWLCVVNDRPVFLQGVNWSPMLPNFADVSADEYRRRLELYRELNMNTFRINGVGILGKECFYDICDELGLLIWQDFPLSCSGIDDNPPKDETSIAEMEEVVQSFVSRRQYHASLLLWCGGNELMDEHGPLDMSHPMLKRLGLTVEANDPGRRYLPCSASGPTFYCGTGRRTDGIHWDVHGPWQIMDSAVDAWHDAYWEGDDALFRSEVGAPGPSSAALTRKYKGDCAEMPATVDNPLWRRTSWWIEWGVFLKEKGREPTDLEEYVDWGQERQAAALRIAAESCKTRFPGIGGLLIWHGHDCFPCTANTAIIDFDGDPKPAALALAEVFGRK